MKGYKGATLIELVITMTLASIMFMVVSIFITRPITAYSDVARRADLVDVADLTLRRIARDIQRSVPNSVRIKKDPANNRVAIEILNTVEGMRYRATPPGPFLSFENSSDDFEVIGEFQFATDDTTCSDGNCRLVVYNTGANLGGAVPSDNPSPGANVYSTQAAPNCPGASTNCLPPPGSVTISPASTSVTISNTSGTGRLQLSDPVLFALPSLTQRIYVSDTPVTYVCDYSSGWQEITRYWDYTINQVQPIERLLSPLSGASSAPLAKNITNCDFTYIPGSSQRNSIVSMKITVEQGGESVTLMRQMGVFNAL